MTQSGELDPDSNPLAFLLGGGEMGSLIRSMDWSETSLGPVAKWSQSLRTTVSICLASDLPICVIWGPGLIQLYNDAYRVIVGNKHPMSMGQNFPECFRDAWPVIGAAHDSALSGDTAFLESQQIFLQRHGYVEECFFTFSFSPVRDEAGRVGGLFHPVIEMTTQMLSERRTRTLRDLSAQTGKAKSVSEALSFAAQTLAEYDLDLPFVLLYALDADGDQARLVGATGFQADSVALSTVGLGLKEQIPWPLEEVARTGLAMQIDDVKQRIGPAPLGPYPELPNEALVLPIILPGASRPVAIFIAGVSARLRMNEAYRSFYDLLASAVTTAVANARAYDDERRRAKALADLDRAKTAFFSNVSHEFRTPLTLMLGPVEDALAASDEHLPPLQRERLEVVHRNGLRLQRLVNCLLDFSRIEAGRVRATYEPTDLAEFTADLASNFRSACDKAGLELRVDCLPLSEPVFVDRTMWETLLLNLLSNAFKFTFEGKITVSLRQVDGAVELRVRDTGTGVPAEEVPLLFERFHRVENAQGRTHEGSGIGLALVQELVKLHGGVVSVDSELGRGTTFTISIPLGSQHLPKEQVGNSGTAAQPTAEVNSFVEEALRWLPDVDQHALLGAMLPSPPDDLTGCTPFPRGTDDGRPLVLVADDNADMRQYLVRLLGARYRTEAVPDGEAALAAVREQIPDLILTDVMMPRLDGFGLLQALRSDPRTSGVPVVMLSARAGEESRIEGMQEGADDYLVKPFSGRELLARVSAHLQMARMRQESTEAIQASESQLRALVKASSDVVYRMNADWAEMRQLQGREFIADTHEPNLSWLEKYIHPDHHRLVIETIREAIHSKSAFELEHQVLRTDGTLGWTFSRAIPLFDNDGTVVEWLGMASDVTARKQAQEVLLESEARIRAFADAAPAMLWETNPAGQCTFLSREWYSFTGQTEAEALGLGWTDATHPGDQAEAGRLFLAANTRRDKFQLEYRLRGAGGGYRWALDVGRPRFAATGEYLGMVGVVIDIDERKQAENALRASEERRRLAVDAAELGTWHVEPGTRAMQTDDLYRVIFGTTEVWTDYLQAVAAIHPDDQPAVLKAVAAATRLDDPAPYAIEYRVIHPDGSLHWISARGRPSYEGTGAARRVTSFDGTVADITERKLGEEEREQLVARLQEQDRRKDEFLAMLAHELRNPLAPISAAADLLRLTGLDAARVKQTSEIIARQVNHMTALVDDLLDVSRVTGGLIKLEKTDLDVKSVVSGAVEQVRPLIEARRHHLSVHLPPETALVKGDAKRLIQVVVNLLNNAAKYTPEGGTISITLETDENHVAVRVADNGIGMTPEVASHAFELFAQAERTSDRSQGGLGIGLAVVDGLVKLHGGKIKAHSAGHGLGSEFILSLPRLENRAASKRENSLEDLTLTAANKRLKIMVVDDNIDAAQTLAMLVEALGYQVFIEHSSKRALERATLEALDVCLLDIGLPDMDGNGLARRLQSQPKKSRCVLIAVTGYGQDGDKKNTLAAGFDHHLVKPVDAKKLASILAQIKSD